MLTTIFILYYTPHSSSPRAKNFSLLWGRQFCLPPPFQAALFCGICFSLFVTSISTVTELFAAMLLCGAGNLACSRLSGGRLVGQGDALHRFFVHPCQ